MRRVFLRHLLLLLPLAGCVPAGGEQPATGAAPGPFSATVAAGPCPDEAAHWVGSGRGRCIAFTAYGPARADTLVVVLHGDLSGGGPAGYHRAMAQRVSAALPAVRVAAMIRPGYPDPEGRVSDGDAMGRMDSMTAVNVGVVADAILGLKARTGARRVIAIGHSGGAGTVANILAMQPGAIDDAVLIACPCALAALRPGGRPWTRSIDPYAVVERVPASARVLAYTGSQDRNTMPSLAQSYVSALARRNVAAWFEAVSGAGHNDVMERVWDLGFEARLRELAM